MAKTAEQRVAELQKKRDQLNARLQRERARLDKQKRRERDSRLMALGIAIETAMKRGDRSPDDVRKLARRYLTGRTLERALTGPLAPDADATAPSSEAARSEPPRSSGDHQ